MKSHGKGYVKTKRYKILFLCTGNSCRSQMAEGWARFLKPHAIEPYSAGTDPRGLDPAAVSVMAEAGIDISEQHAKLLDGFKSTVFDFVITLCDEANESCPLFPGHAKRIHRSFDDPPKLAKYAKTEADVLAVYRRIRDEIRAFVEHMPGNLEPSV